MPEIDEPDEVAEDRVIELPKSYRAIKCEGDLPTYLQGRQVTLADCSRHSIGYCKTGFFSNRVIVPIYFPTGELATFIARWMDNGHKQIGPKVLYPKGSKKSRVLFNQRIASKHNTVIVTEGVFDALRTGTSAVALLGKHASDEQLKLLIKMGQKRRLVVLLDNDAKDDAEFLADELAEVCPEVYLGSLPEGVKDPGEASKKDIARVLRTARRIGDTFAQLQL
jgi:DNA primase